MHRGLVVVDVVVVEVVVVVVVVVVGLIVVVMELVVVGLVVGTVVVVKTREVEVDAIWELVDDALIVVAVFEFKEVDSKLLVAVEETVDGWEFPAVEEPTIEFEEVKPETEVVIAETAAEDFKVEIALEVVELAAPERNVADFKVVAPDLVDKVGAESFVPEDVEIPLVAVIEVSLADVEETGSWFPAKVVEAEFKTVFWVVNDDFNEESVIWAFWNGVESDFWAVSSLVFVVNSTPPATGFIEVKN